MDKKKKNVLVVVLFSILFTLILIGINQVIIAVSFYEIYNKEQTNCTIIHNTTNVYNEYNNHTLIEYDYSTHDYGGELGKFEAIAKAIAENNEYIPDKFDCTEFTEETVRWYRREGWDAWEYLVQTNCDPDLFDVESCRRYKGRHSIVCVGKSRYSCALYVEATTGEIIEPKNYEAYGII